MRLSSVRFKISILYTVILGLILLAYSILLYTNLSYVVYHQIDRNLQRKAKEIEEVIRTYSKVFEADRDPGSVSLKRVFHLEEIESEELFQWPSVKKVDQMWQYKVHTLGIAQDYVVVYYPSGEVIEKSGNVQDFVMSVLEESFKGVPKDRTVIKDIIAEGFHMRVITKPVERWGAMKYVVQLATPLEPQLFTLRSKRELILVTIPIFMVLASFIGRFLVIKMFKPIAEITQTARSISYKDMSKRVQLAHADEELKSLVDGFNDMIARLEDSFKYIEEFSANVAHELKTPLAIIRGELEVVLRHEREPQEYKRAIAVALDEVQGMLKTVNDLLLLAKLDYHTDVFKFERTDFGEFLTDIFEQSKILASAKGIEVAFDPPAAAVMIEADRLHLRRLFFNLIDNAIKFTPKGGRIKISLGTEDRLAAVAISDNGVGIADEDLPKIFDRFFHMDRTDEAPSVNGLGLSIVQSIARVHRGAVDVKSRLGLGTTFFIKLPLV